jgi:hypothetical protein
MGTKTDYLLSKLDLSTQKRIVERYKPSNISEDSERILENKVWFNAEEEGISRFYRTASTGTEAYRIRKNYFWYNAFGKKRHITHSGLPKNISETMARILFHNGIEIKVNEQDSEDLQEIIKANQFNFLLNEGAMVESWGGKFAYKLSFDETVSDKVIVDLAEVGTFDVVRKRNIIQEIVFRKTIKQGKNEFVLFERYGKGFIKYELHRKTHKEGLVRVPLEDAGLELEDFTFTPEIILASFKPNKTMFGESDYHGQISEFDNLDEAMSGLGNDLRKGLTRTYTPENRLKQNINGQLENPDDFENEYIIITAELREGQKNEVTTSQSDIRTEPYKEATKLYEDSILSNVGLNRVTVGLDSTIGANASAEARLQLESTTLRTRESKVQLWTPFLEDFLEIVLQAQEIFTKQSVKEYEIEVTFNPYIQMPPPKYTVTEILDLMDGEKPIIETVKEARELLKLAKE